MWGATWRQARCRIRNNLLHRFELLRAQYKLRNLAVAKAYRSYGSMIHFQFGDLCQKIVNRRIHERGEFGLMIEIAAWKITQHGRCIATNHSGRPAIDRCLARFVNVRIRSARFDDPVSKIEFTRGLGIELRPDSRLSGDWSGMCNWTLFHRDEVAIKLDYKGHRLR